MTNLWNVSNTSETVFAPDIQPSGFQIIGIFICICCLLGVSGNLLIIIVFAKRRSIRRPINFFVLNLAVSDLIVALLGYPMTAVSAFSNRWIFDDVGCKIYAFICFTSGVSCIMTHAAVGFCRYILICHYGYRKKITEMTVLRMLFSIWMFALFWTISPLMGWSSYVLETVPVSCSVNWVGRRTSDITYTVCVLIGVYVFPLSVIIFSYGMILRKKVCSRARGHGADTRRGYRPRYIQYLEQRVTIISFLMVISFMVAWTPYAIMSAMSVGNFSFDNVFAVLPTLLAKCSCAYNPFIYAFSNSIFRDTVVDIMAPWKKRRVGVSTSPWQPVVYFSRRPTSPSETVTDFPDENLFMIDSVKTASNQKKVRRIQTNPRNAHSCIRIEARDAAVTSPRTYSIDFSVI